MSTQIHDSATCNCSMCSWANRVRQRPQPRTFAAISREWTDAAGEAIKQSDGPQLKLITDLALLGNRLLLEANISGELEAPLKFPLLVKTRNRIDAIP
jgi:hypothetical protein